MPFCVQAREVCDKNKGPAANLDNLIQFLQVRNAELCGAAGAILYNDPADYAPEGTDKVYPEYVWLPKTGAQRGVLNKNQGDPLTPGLPSVDGVFRIPQEKAYLPKIPATPMPYGDVENILKLMEGEVLKC